MLVPVRAGFARLGGLCEFWLFRLGLDRAKANLIVFQFCFIIFLDSFCNIPLITWFKDD